MNTPFLVFKKDPSTGLPRLETSGFELTESESRGLEAELRRKFEPLVHNGNGKVIAFETPVRTFPRSTRFRVSIRRSDQRCPDLLFEPVGEFAIPHHDDNRLPGPDGADDRLDDAETLIAAQVAKQNRGASDWPAGFLKEVERVFSPGAIEQLDRADAHALRFILDELRTIQVKRPNELAPLMVAGYTSLGERMCRDADNERIGMYILAARGIDRLFESLLPKTKPDAAPNEQRGTDVQRVETTIKLRRAGRFLARLLGIPDESMF
jgi:hypothetical protein